MPALDPEADLRGISNELSILSTTLLSEAAQSLPRAVEVSRSHISVAQRGDLYGTLIPGAFYSSRFLMGSCRSLLCGHGFSIAIREGVPTMFTIRHSLRGHAAHGEWQHTKAMQLAALLGTLVVVGVAVNALTIFADGHLRLGTSTAPTYSAVGEEVDRLACYDKLAHQPVPHPAKGANAPALFHF